jgi:hypothetical protein
MGLYVALVYTCCVSQALGSVMIGTTLFAVMGLYVALVYTCCVSQALGSVMIGTTLFAVMGLYVALVSVGCTQLEKIQAALMDIKQQAPSEMNARLVQCVVHHQNVLRLVRMPFLRFIFILYLNATISG